jgi:hypothetical protein
MFQRLSQLLLHLCGVSVVYFFKNIKLPFDTPTHISDGAGEEGYYTYCRQVSYVTERILILRFVGVLVARRHCLLAKALNVFRTELDVVHTKIFCL